MSGLQRFITYLYKYENDEKKENTGFAKIEIRGNMCRMEVHIRNVSVGKPECIVYLFTRSEKNIQGIPVGNITISRGNGDVRYSFETKELSNFGIGMEQVEGIFIPLGHNGYLASQWKEGEILEGRFRILEKKEVQPKEQPMSEETQPQNRQRENRSQVLPGQPERQVSEAKQETSPAQTFREEKETGSPVKREKASEEQTEVTTSRKSVGEQKSESSVHQESGEKEGAAAERETIRATEIPMEQFFDENGWEGVFRKLRLKLNVFYPFEGEKIECVRMELGDIHEFPKKYWYLGNNSFLLHGFFNYKHIIMGETTENGKKEYFIGVPGVFQNQERIMAAMFGFPEFRTAQNAEHKTGNFGYWYRII